MRKRKVIGTFIDYVFDYDGMGVYALVGKSDGKMYIGSSINIEKRLHEHEYFLSVHKGTKKLQAAVDSGERFVAIILEKVPYGNNRFYIFEKEAEYIAAYDTIKNGYNAAPTTCRPVDELRKDVEYWKTSKSKHAPGIVEYVSNMIERYSKPIYK